MVEIPAGARPVQRSDGRMVAIRQGYRAVQGSDGRMVGITPRKRAVQDARGRMRAKWAVTQQVVQVNAASRRDLIQALCGLRPTCVNGSGSDSPAGGIVMTVDPLSLTSLFIVPHVNGKPLASASGFVVRYLEQYYLVTCLHVVTGRDTETGELLSATGAVPDSLLVVHHSAYAANGYGAWCTGFEPLYAEDGTARWIEHPNKCVRDMEHPDEPDVDIAVLSLEGRDHIAYWPLDMELARARPYVGPGFPVFIIGYPFGKTSAGLFPIWKTGHVASDPEASWSPRFFLVDATTRQGMSGSPVLYRPHGYYQDRSDLATLVSGGSVRFMGVYSGRIHADAEIGRVWQPQLLLDILVSASSTALD